MKITRAQRELLGADASELSPAEREHLATLLLDPELQALHQRMSAVRGLIALKRYEAPPSSSEDRCVRALRLHIANGSVTAEAHGLTLTRALSGIAAVCAVLFGIQAAVAPPSGALQSALTGRNTPTFEEFIRGGLGPNSVLFPDDSFPFRLVPTGDYAYSNVVPRKVNRASIFFAND